MKKDKKSLLLLYEFESVFAELENDEERGRLIMAIFAYERRCEEPDFSGTLRYAWRTHIKPKMDELRDNYANKCNKLRKNANARWDIQKGANASDDMQNNANALNNMQLHDSKSDSMQNNAIALNNMQLHDSKSDSMQSNAIACMQKHEKPQNPMQSDAIACYKEKEKEKEKEKDYPSNLQSTSIITNPRARAREGEKPVAISVCGDNAEQTTVVSRPASLDGMDFYNLSNPEACRVYREVYPRHQGSVVDIQTAWVLAIAGGAKAGDIVMAAKKYAAECRDKKTDPQYIKMPQNFISSGAWKQYVPKYLPSCPHCHGQGIYEDGGRMIMCDCDRRYGP